MKKVEATPPMKTQHAPLGKFRFTSERSSIQRQILIVASSFFVHLSVFLGAKLLYIDSRATQPQTKPIYVSQFVEPKKETTLPAPPKKPPLPNKQTPKKIIRQDTRIKPEERTTPPQEARAGLSDSIALKNQGTAGLAIAQGNSSMLAVNPEDANKPPPAPLSEGDELEKNSINEAIADSPAQCPTPPGLALTDDAINAGITSGTVIIKVTIGEDGIVKKAVLEKGTGFEIDNLALAAAQKISCKAALANGKPVAIKDKKIRWNIMLD